MDLNNRKFIWGLTLFILGTLVFFTQLSTFVYFTFDTWPLVIELIITSLALCFMFIGGKIVNQTLEE